jgi:hypothetical protein
LFHAALRSEALLSGSVASVTGVQRTRWPDGLRDAVNTFVLQHASACVFQDQGIELLAAILPAA